MIKMIKIPNTYSTIINIKKIRKKNQETEKRLASLAFLDDSTLEWKRALAKGSYAKEVIGHGRIPVGDGPIEINLIGGHWNDFVYVNSGLVQYQVVQDGHIDVILIFTMTQVGAVVHVSQIHDFQKGSHLLVIDFWCGDLIFDGILNVKIIIRNGKIRTLYDTLFQNSLLCPKKCFFHYFLWFFEF